MGIDSKLSKQIGEDEFPKRMINEIDLNKTNRTFCICAFSAWNLLSKP